MTSLAELLGYAPTERLVIISCDDLGSCHAANVGVFDALRHGAATCTSLMVPAPWALHAARNARDDDDIGVHLTLNAEHELYRWGPVTHAPSLLSGEAGFPRDLDDLWEHADLDEVARELRAQITRASAWGVDVTHLSPHLTAITLRPEFFAIYIELAAEFRLPIRLPSTVTTAQAGFPFRELATDAGLLYPDHFDHDWRPGSRRRVLDALGALEAGVTELHIQPVIDTAEVRALTDVSAAWIDDHAFAIDPGGLAAAVRASGAIPIGYRELRTAMRAR